MRPGRVAPRSHGPAFVALAVLLGFLLSVGALQERLREAELPGRAVQLRALIEQRRGTVEELMAEVARLSERVGELQGSSDAGPQELERLLRRLARLRTIAGMAPVAGPGLVVTLTDSARPPRTSEEESDLRIQDVDLQIVINALWQAGAEAVTVHGHPPRRQLHLGQLPCGRLAVSRVGHRRRGRAPAGTGPGGGRPPVRGMARGLRAGLLRAARRQARGPRLRGGAGDHVGAAAGVR